MTDTSILVVDDEPQIRRVLRSTLSSQGYVIIEAKTGEEAVDAVRKEKPDLVLLDVNMPGIGGIEACREIRLRPMRPLSCSLFETRSATKCSHWMLERTTMWSSPSALRNCWRAFVRRCDDTLPATRLPPFVSKDLSMDFESRQLMVRGEEVHLTPKEFDVFKHLIANQGKPLTHRRLLQSVWGPEYGEETENLARGHQSIAQKDRKRSGTSEIHPNGTVGGIPLPATKHEPPRSHPLESHKIGCSQRAGKSLDGRPIILKVDVQRRARD